MAVRKYLPKIHIHPILMLFMIIGLLTGTFIELLIMLIIVFIHELGHYTMAKAHNWRIKGMTLWVFGGVMETDEHGTRPIKEEVQVILAGPIQHIFIYLIAGIIDHLALLPESIIALIYYYNTIILLFNLLPIFPLDGGKILFIWLSSIVSYSRAHHIIIIFSIIACLLLIMIQLYFFPFTFSAFCLLVFLILENRLEWKRRYYTFFRFLLQRYEIGAYSLKMASIHASSDQSLLQVLKGIRRNKRHIIHVDYLEKSIEITEQDCLGRYFSPKKYCPTIGDLIKEKS